MRFGRDRHFRQIVLVDAPVVLGRERWADSPVVQQVIAILLPLFPGLLPQTRHLIAQMVIAALTEVATCRNAGHKIFMASCDLLDENDKLIGFGEGVFKKGAYRKDLP